MHSCGRLFRIASAGLLGLAAATAAQADCGSIPFYSPFQGIDSLIVQSLPGGDAVVQFDPTRVVVYEPGQRAVVLWNGREEILLLSTELRTSQPVSILEVIPFPSRPEAKLGEFETFEQMQALLIEKSMWKVASGGGVAGVGAPERAARIDFHQQMGAHDLAVVEVLDAPNFVKWVGAFLTEKGAVDPKVRPEFAAIIDNYVARGFKWFAFDIINTTNEVQSRQPIEYRFATDAAYYPLEISSLETGKTRINLLFVTHKPLKPVSEVKFASRKYDRVTINAADLEKVSTDWSAFMGNAGCEMQQIRIKGDIRKLKTDFLAR